MRFIRISGKYKAAKKAFESSESDANPLSIFDLRKLQQQYPYHPEYGYAPETLDKRGKDRADQLTGLIRNKSTFLELGCWDGMVTFHLQKLEKTACGIDNRTIGFDPRAIEAGVNLTKMDAAKSRL